MRITKTSAADFHVARYLNCQPLVMILFIKSIYTTTKYNDGNSTRELCKMIKPQKGDAQMGWGRDVCWSPVLEEGSAAEHKGWTIAATTTTIIP
jgi:hypothetical protein